MAESDTAWSWRQSGNGTPDDPYIHEVELLKWGITGRGQTVLRAMGDATQKVAESIGGEWMEDWSTVPPRHYFAPYPQNPYRPRPIRGLE